MKCEEVHSHLLDLASGSSVGAEVRNHLTECKNCATELDALRGTMALLDEWQAPADVSPFFMTRLRARLQEESAPAVNPWFAWVRRPMLAATMALVMIIVGGVSMLRMGSSDSQQQSPTVTAKAQTGTAVGDLQYLDGNSELLSSFELLDDIGAQN